MPPGKDVVSPFRDDAQMSNIDEDLFSKLDADGDGVVTEEEFKEGWRHMMGKTVVIEKSSMNWSHFGIGIGITIGYFVIYWFLPLSVLGGSLDVIWFSCNPCFVMPVVAIAASVKGMPHIATGIGAVFMAGVALFLGWCALIIMGSGMMLEG
jgi:hypothetical protein